MDWSKAKNLLIAAFIITNVFLVYNIRNEMFRQNEVRVVSEKHLDDVKQYLNDNGINLNVHIPEETISLPMLIVRYRNFNSDKIAKELLGGGYKKETEALGFNDLKREIFKKGNKELIVESDKRLIYKSMGDKNQDCNLNEKIAIKTSNDFLKQYGLMQEDIILDQIYYGVEEHICDEPVYKLIYNQTYKNKFLGESYIHVYVNDKGIIAVEAMLLEYEKTQQQRKKVIPATEALMRVMNIILQENEKPVSINEIEIGYYFSPTYYTESDWKGIDSATASPSWKITIQNGKTYFIEAYKN
ncbi:MAG TPA: two-component system regulatory protein YycI [Oscillospiraceae bacterium]|nr:two-component system regulatory protein YycI [Oscillospiraceae bacterium]